MEASVEVTSVEVNSLKASTKNFRESNLHGSFHGMEVWKHPWELSRASTKNVDRWTGLCRRACFS